MKHRSNRKQVHYGSFRGCLTNNFAEPTGHFRHLASLVFTIPNDIELLTSSIVLAGSSASTVAFSVLSELNVELAGWGVAVAVSACRCTKPINGARGGFHQGWLSGSWRLLATAFGEGGKRTTEIL